MPTLQVTLSPRDPSDEPGTSWGLLRKWFLLYYGISRTSWIQKDTWTPMFTAALFTVARTWKQPKCPSTEEWIKKMWYRYTMQYYSAIKKNKIMPSAATWMQLEIIILSVVSQEKTNILCYRLHVESKIWHKWTYLQNRNRLRHREQTGGCQGEGGRGGMEWEVGISRCQLLYIGWINNKVLLYSTGNYIQYPVINHNGKEYEKEWYIYIYV